MLNSRKTILHLEVLHLQRPQRLSTIWRSYIYNAHEGRAGAKVANLCWQLQTATEKDTNAQATIDELQRQITLHRVHWQTQCYIFLESLSIELHQ